MSCLVVVHRFGAESQVLQPAEALPPPSQIASMMATRGDSFSSQASAGSVASTPARVTADEGQHCLPDMCLALPSLGHIRFLHALPAAGHTYIWWFCFVE